MDPPSSPSARAFLRTLEALGLDERRARLYAHLVQAGPMRASELASATGIHRTEAYRDIEDLIRGGYATASLTRPTTYAATPPERVWSAAISAHQARGRALEVARAESLALLAELAPHHVEAPGRLVHRILQGRAAIYDSLEALLAGARKTQWMVSTTLTAEGARPTNKPFHATVLRANEGLPMRLLLRDSAGLADAMAPLMAGPHVEIRVRDFANTMRFTIVDEEHVVQWLATDPTPGTDAKGDVAMLTNAPDFVRAQRSLYESLWASARPLASAGAPAAPKRA